MKRWFPLCCLLLIGVCFALDTNPLSAYRGTDSSVFTYVAQAMLDGRCPYRDVFDHKGLFLYFLNVLGLSLDIGVVGVWIVECCFVLISGIFAFRCLADRTSPAAALGGLVFYSALFSYVMMGGNMTESYACCISLVSLSVLCRDFGRGEFGIAGCLLHGVVATLLLLLRPNLAVMPVVVAIAYCAESWRLRSVRKFLCWTSWSVSGAGVAFLPFAWYLTARGLWTDCFDVYVRFNLSYAGHSGGVHPALWFALLIVLVGMVALRFAHADDRRSLRMPAVYATIAALVLAANPGRLHYYGVMLPALPFLIAAIMKGGSPRKPVRVASFVVIAGLVALELAEIAAACVSGHYLSNSIRNRRPENPLCYIRYDRGGLKMLDELSPAITDLNSVTVLGNMCLVYGYLGARTPLRFPYQMPIVQHDERIKEEVVEALQNGSSQFVITTGFPLEESLNRALARRYRRIMDSGSFSLYEAKDRSR